MGEALQRRLLQRRFEGPYHEVALHLMLAAGELRSGLDRAFAGAGLTPTQYNVMRILNGAAPAGLARGEIARRMLERAPDLTRLLDRLARRGLVERARSDADRRHSLARITRRGRALLAQLHPRVQSANRAIAKRLSPAEARALSRLLEKFWDGGG